ncbi:endonuclease/exonuclease/phosphatase family protein [Aeromicrobium sp.]|uniref:endonuclease/exonuclease/phosphatase family protein n=1 Tax=Aeromicrobium sp. TaxID=1871063 RepID=UPI0019963DF3|nr:endonuclease/exonuclease/phosphatase family protein [Aeromicrobium sp.]MBC7631287.1 endonuclease/exonuclease/phosphatase family protein [Aeromicrobium sp.]
MPSIRARALVIALASGAVVLAGVQPAAAASSPSTVGLVSFTAASLSGSSASLTIDWPDALRATRYDIYLSRHYTMENAKKLSSGRSSRTITDLVRGADYFVQVRGRNGSKVGNKSLRVGHTTIRAHGPVSGPSYRVMTYNVCSQLCGGFSQRQPGALERVSLYRPDVLATQEAGYLATPAGYALARYKSAKRLFFRSSRFNLAVCAPDAPATCERTGDIFLGRHDGNDRWAVWAELIDRATGQHVMFADVHTVSGDSSQRSAERKIEMNTLLREMATANPARLPVVYLGDFNSHKNRAVDSVADVMHAAGYYDAFDLAQTLTRQHLNSFNGFRTTPTISYRWGDHVDHVWVRPGKTRVLGWRNGVNIRSGRLVTPIPSDHSPLVIDVQVN